MCVGRGEQVLAVILHACVCKTKGRPSACTDNYYICVGKGDLMLALFNMTCLCVGKGERVIVLKNTTYLYLWKGVTKCLYFLI